MRPGPTQSEWRRHFGIASFLVLVVPSFVACGSSGGKTETNGVPLTDANNYKSTTKLTIPTVETAAGVDLDVCWTDIAKDIQCHDISPLADIDNVSFLQVPKKTHADLEANLATGALSATQVAVYRDWHTMNAATCTKLSAMAFGSAMLDPAKDYVAGTDASYMLLLSKGTTPGSGARTMLFLQPSATSTTTAVMAPDGCDSNILDFKADLHTPTALAIPAAGPYLIDWSQLTQDSMGGTVIFQNIDQLMLAYYEGMTVSELETKFLDVDRIATSLYKLTLVSGAKSADLTQATDESGAAFAGFDRTSGVWAVALLCSGCQVPAPVALSIIQPQ